MNNLISESTNKSSDTFRLSKVVEFVKKTNHRANEGKKEGQYKFFTSSPVQSKFLDEFDYLGEYLIFGTGGSASIHYCNGPFSATADCLIAKSKNHEISLKFVFQYLKHNMYLLENGFRGAGLKHISKSFIEKIIIISPKKPDAQNKIVSVLEKAEQLREWRKQSDKLTQEYLYSVFVKMFGNRGPNHVIGDIADFISSGSTPLGGQATYLDEGIVFIRSQNVHMNELKLNDVSHISEDVHRKMRRTWVKNGDVLLNITGASLGRVAVYDGESYKANVNQHVCIIRVNRERALPSYISYFLSMPNAQKEIWTVQSGASRQALNFKQVKGLKIYLPDIERQKAFVSLIGKVNWIKKQQAQSLEEITKLFESLNCQIFKGDIVC